jgi:hypothetical protein
MGTYMETAWLIERGQAQHQNPPLWWAGNRVVGEWTNQPGVAIRFARKGDAEIIGRMMPQLGEAERMWTVTEHSWS